MQTCYLAPADGALSVLRAKHANNACAFLAAALVCHHPAQQFLTVDRIRKDVGFKQIYSLLLFPPLATHLCILLFVRPRYPDTHIYQPPTQPTMRCTLVAVAFVALLSVALCEDGGDGDIDDAGNIATCMDHTNANACGNDEACKWDGDACQDDFSGGPTGTLSLCCPAVVQARLPKVLLLLFFMRR